MSYRPKDSKTLTTSPPPLPARALDGSQVTAEHMELLKALPIFRVHGGVGAAGTGARAGPKQQQPVAFASVSGGTRELLLAPKHSNPALLGPEFAVEGHERDTELLETLKVDRVGKGTFFREHVLPRWAEQELPPGKCWR